jgi:mono/diheme cytochrome c family protein
MKRLGKLNYVLMASVLLAGSLIIMSMSYGVMQNWPVPPKYKAMKNAKAGVKDTEAVGKTLFTQHCASCHGAKGAGDGKKAAMLKTEMKDWSTKAVQAQTDGELYYKSFVGKGEMPNFEKKIPAEGDRWFVINFIRTLKK